MTVNGNCNLSGSVAYCGVQNVSNTSQLWPFVMSVQALYHINGTSTLRQDGIRPFKAATPNVESKLLDSSGIVFTDSETSLEKSIHSGCNKYSKRTEFLTASRPSTFSALHWLQSPVYTSN